MSSGAFGRANAGRSGKRSLGSGSGGPFHDYKRGGGRSGGGRFRDYGRGGGRGGRGGVRNMPVNRPNSTEVALNFYELKLDSSLECIGFKYDIEIYNARRIKKKDTDGKCIEPWQFEVVMETRRIIQSNEKEGEKVEVVPKGPADLSKAPELSRRILIQLADDIMNKHKLGLLCVDGSKQGYSPQRLFFGSNLGDNDSQILPANSTTTSAGTYGPAHINQETNSGKNIANQKKSTNVRVFDVVVKANCSEENEYKDRVKNKWFKVKLTEVGTVDVNNKEKASLLSQWTQCIETAVKSYCMSNMRCLGRQPRSFFFHEDEQDNEILGRALCKYLNGRHSYAPFIGLKTAIRFFENGCAFLNCDTSLEWINREKYPRTTERVKLLNDLPSNPGMSTVAGVRIPGHLKSEISDPKVQAEIESKLRKLRFHVIYECPPSWVDRQVNERGKTKDQAMKIRKKVRLNVRMDDDDKMPIIWTANDATRHPIEREGEPQPLSVREYFEKAYCIRLRYPNMPIIKIKETRSNKGGYFPLEFLYQSAGKATEASEEVQRDMALKHNDEFCGYSKIDYINQVKDRVMRLKKVYGRTLDEILTMFNITASRTPLLAKAKVIKEPSISCSGTQLVLKDGSIELGRYPRYSRAADLNSFAIVDTVCDGSCEEFIEGLFQKGKEHNAIDLPPNGTLSLQDQIRAVTIRRDRPGEMTPDEIHRLFELAIKRSREFFLEDLDQNYARRGLGFKTRVAVGENISDCLVMKGGQYFVLSHDVRWETDELVLRERDGMPEKRKMARIMAKTDNGILDLFNLRFVRNKNNYEAFFNGKWNQVQFDPNKDFVWCTKDGDVLTRRDFVESHPCVSTVDKYECPAMVFFYLGGGLGSGGTLKAQYNFCKFLAHHKFGVQTQVIDSKKWKDQKRKQGGKPYGAASQYCSNVLRKLNTKLFNVFNQARAWDISVGEIKEGMPWIVEVPTMVVGISFSKGAGQSLKIITGSVALEAQCLNMAQTLKMVAESASNATISQHVMKDFFKDLAMSFYGNVKLMPKRILVYRDGASDGSFDEIIETEVNGIRLACDELNKESNLKQCACKKGCLKCTPLVTYVVCQSQHSIKMTPTREQKDQKNVFSGTVLDVTDIKPGGGSASVQFTSGSSNDFLLTAHGGLKGTSKPVYYRVLWNENALDKDTLKTITYYMSYQYGTATKVIRDIPVVHYSKRLANLTSSYSRYLTDLNETHLGCSLRRVRQHDEEIYVRSEEKPGGTSETAAKDLLPDFGPYGDGSGACRPAFRPHMAA